MTASVPVWAIGPLEMLPLALLGAVLGLDVVSFPQAMISRPLVASTLGGALIGNAAAGLYLGVAMELIALETLPFGASRYPEWGSAALVGGALYGQYPALTPGAIVAGMLASLASAFVTGWSMVQLRRWNARWARQRLARLDAGSWRANLELQLLGMTADLARGALMTVVLLLLLRPVVHASVSLWSVDQRLSNAVAISTAAAVAAGASWKIFHSTPGARWFFAVGLAAGLGMLAIQ